MPWYIWLLAADISISALAKVATVGRPRKPLEPVDAAFAVVITALYVYALISWGTA